MLIITVAISLISVLVLLKTLKMIRRKNDVKNPDVLKDCYGCMDEKLDKQQTHFGSCWDCKHVNQCLSKTSYRLRGQNNGD